MAICKRVLLVTFVLLCFIIITAEARSLRGMTTINEATSEAPKGSDDLFTPNQESVVDTDELVSMDYTPTKKNPPIHN
uniref:Root meristem growth factor 9 n=1 Tax=Fagus sylvatica TaxID=28930 RepID=A0A2N9HPW7_FAGSY